MAQTKLIDEPDFIFVKNSLSKINPQNVPFCEKLISYIDMSSLSGDDEFFYDQMIGIRFAVYDGIACTDENKLIYLNPPQMFNSLAEWEFIYDHECMHQLWDTFKVGEKIKKEGTEYIHELLNIASDCIINDYLDFYRRKKIPGGPNGGLITPESVKRDYGVEYNRREDTQYTLYMKLLKVVQEDPGKKSKFQNDPMGEKIKPGDIKKGGSPPPPPGRSEKHSEEYKKGWSDGIADVLSKKVDPLRYKPIPVRNDYDQGYNDVLDQIKQGMEEGIGIGPGGDKGGNSDLESIPWDVSPQDQKDIDNMDGQEAADEAQEAADEAQEAADKAKSNNDGSSDKAQKAQEAQEAADKAQEAADKAQEAADRGDDQEAQKQAKEAKKQAAKAKGKAQESKGGHGHGKNVVGYGGEVDDLDKLEQQEIGNITRQLNDNIKKYAGKISGDIGNFIKQCQASAELRQSGLAVNVGKAKANWKAVAFSELNTFIRNIVFQKKREWKPSYSRVKRGSGIVKMGEPIQQGRITKDDKFDVSIAFYLDKSGSMGSDIQNAARCMYELATAIKKEWYREKTINEFDFNFYSFDDYVHPLKQGQIPPSSGCTMSIGGLVEHMYTNENRSLINFIITDGGTDIDESTFNKYINKGESLVIVAANSPNPEMENTAKKVENFVFIQTSPDFSF